MARRTPKSIRAHAEKMARKKAQRSLPGPTRAPDFGRSKYMPHMGAKQRDKGLARSSSNSGETV